MSANNNVPNESLTDRTAIFEQQQYLQTDAKIDSLREDLRHTILHGDKDADAETKAADIAAKRENHAQELFRYAYTDICEGTPEEVRRGVDSLACIMRDYTHSDKFDDAILALSKVAAEKDPEYVATAFKQLEKKRINLATVVCDAVLEGRIKQSGTEIAKE